MSFVLFVLIQCLFVSLIRCPLFSVCYWLFFSSLLELILFPRLVLELTIGLQARSCAGSCGAWRGRGRCTRATRCSTTWGSAAPASSPSTRSAFRSTSSHFQRHTSFFFFIFFVHSLQTFRLTFLLRQGKRNPALELDPSEPTYATDSIELHAAAKL